MTTLVRGRLDRLGRVAQATKASAPMRPQRHGPLHGRRRQPGQHRRLVRPRVRRGDIVGALPESPAIEQARDSRVHSEEPDEIRLNSRWRERQVADFAFCAAGVIAVLAPTRNAAVSLRCQRES